MSSAGTPRSSRPVTTRAALFGMCVEVAVGWADVDNTRVGAVRVVVVSTVGAERSPASGDQHAPAAVVEGQPDRGDAIAVG